METVGIQLGRVVERCRRVQRLRAREQRLRGSIQRAADADTGDDLRRTADRLAEAERLAQLGSWETDLASGRVWWSQHLCRLVGEDPASFEPDAADLLEAVHRDDREAFEVGIEAVTAGAGPMTLEHRLVRRDGEVRWVEARGHALTDDNGRIVGLRGTVQDVTERRNLREEAVRKALHDPVTGLANRTSFQRQVREALVAADPWQVVVAVADIDGFKALNDRQGAAAGDDLLRAVADRLTGDLPAGTTVARLGGDEFAILFAQATPGPEGTADVATLVSEPLRNAFVLPSGPAQVTVSAGVASNVTGREDPDQLLRNADIAMRIAKAGGGDATQVFEPRMHQDALERLALESELRRAVTERAFELHYQPVVALGTGRMVGLEVLLRWERRGHGPVSPVTFIPLCEQLGLIAELGRWVLDQACRQARAWEQAFPTHPPLTVAVNVSPWQLDDPQLVESVSAALKSSGLEPDRLVVEITESALSQGSVAAVTRVWELRRLGVAIAIDDFGTGYSSLSRLREFPLDVLKIDRSFVRDLDASGSPIVEALLAMARSLQLRVVCEGVETPAQLAQLVRYGCDEAQGFLLCRPLPVAAIERVLRDPTWDTRELEDATPVTVDDQQQHGHLAELFEECLDAAHARGGDLLGELLDQVVRLTGMESAHLARIRWEHDRYEVLRARNHGRVHIPEGLVMQWSDTICRRALSDDARVVRDVPTTYPDSVAGELGIGTYVSVPVVTDSGVVRGTLCGTSRQEVEVDDDAVAALHLIARLIADCLLQEEA